MPNGISAIDLVLAAFAVGLLYWIIRLQTKTRKLMAGKNAETLDESITNLKKEISELNKFRSITEKDLKSVERRLRRSMQAVKTVRFNPFPGTGEGSNQSFASAIMSEEGDGVVMSSLYARDHVSMYAKPIKGGESEFELSKEEKEVLSQAKETLAN